MSETERRRSYQYNNVLIDSARILDPQFSDAVVFLSGAQIEMLRNVSQYLNRRASYVTDTEPGYYMMPTDEDYDDILEIVADLEETLMGNPNTIWGYEDRYAETAFLEGIGSGYTRVDGEEVPEGEVWTVQAAEITQTDATPRDTGIAIRQEISVINLVFEYGLAQSVPLMWSGGLTMKEGDWIRGSVTDLPSGQYAVLSIWGSKMKVPI